jgi:hypothetical protein
MKKAEAGNQIFSFLQPFIVAISLAVVLFSSGIVQAQSTAFSYQGTLAQNGTPANGTFQMTFSLWTAETGGNQVGTTIGPQPVVVTNGNFAALLDFGAGAFPGDNRFLEITVGTTVLSPRPRMQSVPYAIRALTVTGPVSGSNASAVLTVTNAQPGITNPSPTNLPPAALRAEATAGTNQNVGVLGVANGADGIGVLGITNGGGNNAIAVLGLSTSPSGSTTGLLAEVSSPNGTAVEAQVAAGGAGYLFKGSSGKNSQFSVHSNGNVDVSGTLAALNLGVTGTTNIFGPLSIHNLLGGGSQPLCTIPGGSVRFCSSSLRYKKAVQPFTGGLDIVNRLTPISFAWKETDIDDLGLVAEDVARVDSRLIFYNSSGDVEGVRYNQLNAVLINAIKQQQEQLRRQQADIDNLKRLVNRSARRNGIRMRRSIAR